VVRALRWDTRTSGSVMGLRQATPQPGGSPTSSRHARYQPHDRVQLAPNPRLRNGGHARSESRPLATSLFVSELAVRLQYRKPGPPADRSAMSSDFRIKASRRSRTAYSFFGKRLDHGQPACTTLGGGACTQCVGNGAHSRAVVQRVAQREIRLEDTDLQPHCVRVLIPALAGWTVLRSPRCANTKWHIGTDAIRLPRPGKLDPPS
jgi:hypothetical protein